jgi:hypothetical protein
MLRPPSEYESTRVELSNRVAKVENLYFDSAIIFFTPKVADKGVNLANLQCTIVQITDRGAWGKEEETFTVEASSLSNRKYRTFDLTTDAEYSLKIIPPPELRMGILEIHFDPNQSNIYLSSMGVSNPSTSTPSTDPAAFQAALVANNAALAQAVGASTGSAVQQALANNEAATEAKSSRTFPATVKAWTGDIRNHLILATNPARIGANLSHPGRLVSVTNTSDVLVAVGDNGRDGVTKYDYKMAADGTFITDQGRDTLPLYAWLLTGRPDTQITITEDLPTAPTPQVVAPP